MFYSRNNGTTHFLAVASATTAVVGFGFDDVKWVVSVAASLFGSAVALYIFRAEMRAQSAALNRAHTELDRIRPPDEPETDDERSGKLPSDGGRDSGD